MLYTQEEEEEEDDDIDGVPMNNNIPMMDFSDHMARLAQGQNYEGAYNTSESDVGRATTTTADRGGYVDDDEDIDGVPLADEQGEGDSVDGVPL